MSEVDPILEHGLRFALVLLRMSGLLIFAPLLAGRMMPRRFRVLLAVAMSAAVYPIVPPGLGVAASVDLFDLLPMVVSELVIGAAIGLVAALPLYAAEMGGTISGHQMGLGIARVFNPEAEAESEAVAHLFFLAALTAYLAIGGLDLVFLAMARTFAHVPLGGFSLDRTPLDLLVGAMSSGMELAIRVCAPVVATMFVILIGMSVISKTMPQVNILSIGFALKILVSLAVLAWTAATIHAVQSDEVEEGLFRVLQWSGGLGESDGR